MRRARFLALFLPLLWLFSAVPAVPAQLPVPEEEPSIASLGSALAETFRGKKPLLWGRHIPGVVDTLPEMPGMEGGGTRVIALTLDACMGEADTGIIALLREHGVPATVFVTNFWLRQNKALAAELAVDPLFTLACHGARHKPASVTGREAYGIAGTPDIPALVREIEENARAVTALTGTRPRWYRSGTAHYDEVALEVIRRLGFFAAGYTVNGDEGGTLSARTVARRLTDAPDRAIVLCHGNKPGSGTRKGLALAIPAMLEAGVRFVPLP